MQFSKIYFNLSSKYAKYSVLCVHNIYRYIIYVYIYIFEIDSPGQCFGKKQWRSVCE